MSVAEISAVNCVLVTKVVVRSESFQRTTDALTKFVPVTVRVKLDDPAATEAGLRLVIVGNGLAGDTTKPTSLDSPPPGAGLNTIILAGPAAAMSIAEIAAVNCIPLTNVVVRSESFHRTTEPLAKLVPLTVRAKAGDPAVAEEGLRPVMVGAGLVGVITKLASFEGPPPGAGLNTITLAAPATAMSPAVIAAVNCVLVTKVVVRSESFHRTTDPLMKFLPVTVRAKARDPAVAEEGLRPATAGPALVGVITKLTSFEGPPLGPGLNTITLAAPAAAMSSAVIIPVSRVSLTKVVGRSTLFHRTTDPRILLLGS